MSLSSLYYLFYVLLLLNRTTINEKYINKSTTTTIVPSRSFWRAVRSSLSCWSCSGHTRNRARFSSSSTSRSMQTNLWGTSSSTPTPASPSMGGSISMTVTAPWMTLSWETSSYWWVLSGCWFCFWAFDRGRVWISAWSFDIDSYIAFKTL